MTGSVPGLDGSWRYGEGTATGGNTQITKGSDNTRYTCHVKDPPPGQHSTLGGARRGWRAKCTTGAAAAKPWRGDGRGHSYTSPTRAAHTAVVLPHDA